LLNLRNSQYRPAVSQAPDFPHLFLDLRSNFYHAAADLTRYAAVFGVAAIKGIFSPESKNFAAKSRQ